MSLLSTLEVNLVRSILLIPCIHNHYRRLLKDYNKSFVLYVRVYKQGRFGEQR